MDLGKYSESFQMLYTGSNAMLKVNLASGESIKAESGAMVSMSSTIDVDGKLEGGLLGGLGRMLSGEKFFFQTLKASRGAGEVLLAPSYIGDVKAIEISGSTPYTVQKDGFFAGSNSLNISTKMQNLAKGLFSGEGFFVMEVTGNGLLFVSSFGAIHEINLQAGEEVIIDNQHLVAWPSNIQFNIEKASGGWISSFTSGEGLVCRFKGPGKVLIQTRNASSFGSWISRYIPAKS